MRAQLEDATRDELHLLNATQHPLGLEALRLARDFDALTEEERQRNGRGHSPAEKVAHRLSALHMAPPPGALDLDREPAVRRRLAVAADLRPHPGMARRHPGALRLDGPAPTLEEWVRGQR